MVEFKEAFFNYRADIQPVLKNISAKILKGEKIGVVGRTGAGKTSITLAISKIIDLT